MNMESAQSQSQSLPQHWNNLPPEILGLILSNLGKHDLLNARMVTHAWNEECLKVLRKSKFTQLLREKNIEDYIRFATPIGPRPFIIPFHLNIESAFEPFSPKTVVETLCQIFGPHCVSILTLCNYCNWAEENVKELGLFLALISPGLETLDMTGFSLRNDFITNQDQVITFPKLKKLICNTCYCAPGREREDLAYISIIENSPNLEDLTLTDPCDLEFWPLNFSQLKSLSIDTMCKVQSILDKIIPSSGSSVLRELSIRDDGSGTPEDMIVLYNILESVSLTLKSLRFWENTMVLRRNVGIPLIVEFPKLPCLEHLGLEYVLDDGFLLNPQDMNFCPETFPSLKSIELPIGIGFDVRIAFPNLNKLTLRLGCTDGPEHFNVSLESLQVFPNPSKLSLVNIGQRQNVYVKYLLGSIAKSNWSKNIEEFEMIGFNEDYLGQVLSQLEFSPRVVLENCDGMMKDSMINEFQNNMWRIGMEYEEDAESPGVIILTGPNQMASFKMTNVTTLKLEIIDYSQSYHRHRHTSYLSSQTSFPIPIPNLTGFGKHFLKLRMIEVSKLL